MENKKERIVFDVKKFNPLREARRQQTKKPFKATHLLTFLKRRLFNQMRYYTSRIFHALIITCLSFALWGCGYKGDPVYKDTKSPTKTEKKQ